eukprot:19734_5
MNPMFPSKLNGVTQAREKPLQGSICCLIQNLKSYLKKDADSLVIAGVLLKLNDCKCFLRVTQMMKYPTFQKRLCRESQNFVN